MKIRLRIVIPAGNGQVGSVLSRHFHARGHQVVSTYKNRRVLIAHENWAKDVCPVEEIFHRESAR
jgi:Trk K+ transport system NAD-binding subunit